MTKDTFAARVMALKSRMYHIACGYLQGEHDRLDAISEATLKAWQKRTSLKDENYFDTWLIRILIRECINLKRKHKRSFPMEELPERAAPQEADPDLQWAVEMLPEKWRIVVVLHYLEGYAVNEVAQILRIPKGTVCSHLFKARSRLKELLKEEIE